MINSTELTSSPIIKDLLSHGHEFSFPQVMRLARMQLGAGGIQNLPEIPWQDRVRVRPDLSFAFPAADVARIELDDDKLLVIATFMGLYGSSSPLPNFYTEDLMDEASADSSVSRDFMDIFHRRSYQLYFQAWSKYRLFIRVAEEKNPLDRERLFCLIGLGERELRNNLQLDASSLLRYSGLLTQFPRSAEGLRTLLKDALGVDKLEVQQCVLRRVPIAADQQMRLGVSGMRLGVDTVLGSEIADRMGKFRIIVGPLKKQQFDRLLPGTPQHDKLASLISLYVIDPFEVDITLILAAYEAQPIRLGDPNSARLGLGTWCFSSATLGEVSTTLPIVHSAADTQTSVRHEPHPSEPLTLLDYYQTELSRLRDLVADFVKVHPDMAPMVSGHMADPGVERLLEGTALLNACLVQKLDDDFPEIIHEVIDAIQPNYLRPIPASTTVVFAPKPNCTEPQIIPVGTELKSVPVDDTECTFTTCYPVEFSPLAITDASFVQLPGKPAAITIKLKLSNIALKDWKVQSLRLFLAGERNHALNLYLVLMRYLNRIVITPLLGGQAVTLEATELKALGFDESELLFPTTNRSAANVQMIHEYFIQPDKFLLLDLLGWDKWLHRGEGTEFEIRFELDKLPFALHRVSNADFALFATPAVNLFPHPAAPLTIRNRELGHPMQPENGRSGHYHIYSVKKVIGLSHDNDGKKTYLPRELYGGRRGGNSLYKLRRNKSALHSGIDFNISLIDNTKAKTPAAELLDIDLTCTNGALPNNLLVGDVCIPNTNSPIYATFSNVKHIINSANPILGNNQLWKRFSLFGLNIRLLNLESLRALLETFILSDCRDYQEIKAQQERLEGIVAIEITTTDRLFGRSMVRGWNIKIKLQRECFTSDGDMYLFSAILDRFMAQFATQGTFTQTTIEDVQGQREYKWPERMGKRELI